VGPRPGSNRHMTSLVETLGDSVPSHASQRCSIARNRWGRLLVVMKPGVFGGIPASSLPPGQLPWQSQRSACSKQGKQVSISLISRPHHFEGEWALGSRSAVGLHSQFISHELQIRGGNEKVCSVLQPLDTMQMDDDKRQAMKSHQQPPISLSQ